MTTSIELPAASVEEAAKAVANRKSMFAKIWFGLTGFFAFMGCVLAVDNAEPYGASDKLDIAIGLGFWILLFATLGAVAVRGARRARAVAARAAGDHALRWYLQERLVVPVDAAQIPQLALTFTIPARVRAALTAVPPARATFRTPTP